MLKYFFNTSTKSVPFAAKKGRPASPAMALARRVFPVPGGPWRSTPFGQYMPLSWNSTSFFRMRTISCSSLFMYSWPAKSSNVTPVVSSADMNLALKRRKANHVTPWHYFVLQYGSLPPILMNTHIHIFVCVCIVCVEKVYQRGLYIKLHMEVPLNLNIKFCIWAVQPLVVISTL